MSLIENTNIRKIKTLLGVIIIGAIGSGLWDVFLKGLVFRLGNFFVTVVSYFNKNYVDHLYSDVRNGSHLELLPAIAIIVFFIFLPFMMLIMARAIFQRHRMSKEIPNQEIQKTKENFIRIKKPVKMIIFLSLITLSFFYIDILIKDTATFKACATVERNLEIIRPYTPDSTYYILRSKFRQINSKQKMVEILDLINKIAKNNNIILPPYHLFGISI